MIKYIYFLAFLLTSIGKIEAQKIINEATLTYKVEIKNSTTNQPVQNSNANQYVIYIKGLSSRSDLITSMGSESAVYDSKKSSGYIAKSYSGQKLLINLTKAEWFTQNAIFQQLKFNVTSETKNISGYECKKAISKLATGETIIVYFEPNIELSNQDYILAFPELKGLPILIERESKGSTFTYTLADIIYDNVASNLFEISQKNYRVMTYEDAKRFQKK
jgi:GLPGLI family protein